MAVPVDICNLALGILGNPATLTSIDPPDGAVEADHCARYYPIAKKMILASHPWGFALRRVCLAKLDRTPVSGGTAFAVPSDSVRLLSVTQDERDGHSASPEYVLEQVGNTLCVVSHFDRVWATYVSSQVNESVFPPTFTMALVRLLASMLAGPMVPGSSGVQLTTEQTKLYQYYLAQAQTEDALQQVDKEHFRNPFMGDAYIEENWDAIN